MLIIAFCLALLALSAAFALSCVVFAFVLRVLGAVIWCICGKGG